MPEIIGEYVDRACTIEMRPQGMPRGQIHRLYEAARTKQERPLTMLAAETLLTNVKAGDTVILATGAGGPPLLPAGETDGPLGAAALGRVLAKGLDVLPVYVSEMHNLRPIIAATEAFGLPVSAEPKPGRSALALEFPLEQSAAIDAAEDLLDEFNPKALIAIEKPGPNSQGEIHSLQGVNLSSMHAKLHWLFDAASRRGIVTLGVGDGGNEIGCGRIAEEVKDIAPFGRVCQCPCEGGFGTVTSTDVLVIGAVSNWAAYGIETCLAYLLRDPALMHDAKMETEALNACVNAGAVDGLYLKAIPYVDGARAETQAAIVSILQMLLENGLKRHDREI